MKKQKIFFVILSVMLMTVFLSCDFFAELAHGPKPEVTYTVTFNVNGATGNPPAEKTVKPGEVIKLPNIGGMSKGADNFVGWSESATIGVGITLFPEDSITVTGDMTFYAQWIPGGSAKIIITFNANGASGAPPPSREVYAGVQIRIPDQGSLGYTGKMFGGWNTKDDGTGMLLGTNTLYTVSGSLNTVEGQFILYAQWYALTDTFTVTFDKNGGSGDVPSPQTVNAGATINLPNGNSLSKEGYIFGGWNTNSDGTGTNYNAGYLYTVTGNITLYAKWNNFFGSVSDVSAFLTSQDSGYDPNEPIYLPVQINLGNMNQTSGWRQLLNTIENSGKYVDLDLSACTMNGTEFNPDYNVSTGKGMIVSITLPNTATSIADDAFSFYHSGFTSLTQVTLPPGLTSIGVNAFLYCTSLTTSLPTNLTSIGEGTFRNCTNLVLNSLPASLISIGNYAFQNCTSLVLTNLPTNLSSIGGFAFSNCTSLEQITLPAGITSIIDYTFSGCTNLSRITLPESLSSIYRGAFSGCTSLTEITLPTGVTTIDYRAFENCTSISQITLPSSLTSIGVMAFYGCEELVLVNCHAVTPPVFSDLGTTVEKVFDFVNTNFTIKVPSASVTAYKTADGWSEYADRISAFE